MRTNNHYRDNRRGAGRSWSGRNNHERDLEQRYSGRYGSHSQYGASQERRDTSAARNYASEHYNDQFRGNAHDDYSQNSRYNSNDKYSLRDDQGFFERAGDRIKNTWGRWTNDNDPRDQDRYDRYNPYGPDEQYGRGNRSTDYRAQQHENWRGSEYDERNEGYNGRNASDYVTNDYGDDYYYDPNRDHRTNRRYDQSRSDRFSGYERNSYHGPYSGRGSSDDRGAHSGNYERHYHYYESYPNYGSSREYGNDYDNSYFDKQEARSRRGVDNEDTTEFYPKNEKGRRRERVENGW